MFIFHVKLPVCYKHYATYGDHSIISKQSLSSSTFMTTNIPDSTILMQWNYSD